MSKAHIVRRVEKITLKCDVDGEDYIEFHRVEVDGKFKYIQVIELTKTKPDILLTKENVQSMIDALQEMLRSG